MLLGHVITDDTLLLVTNYVRGTNLAKSLGLARGTKQVSIRVVRVRFAFVQVPCEAPRREAQSSVQVMT